MSKHHRHESLDQTAPALRTQAPRSHELWGRERGASSLCLMSSETAVEAANEFTVKTAVEAVTKSHCHMKNLKPTHHTLGIVSTLLVC